MRQLRYRTGEWWGSAGPSGTGLYVLDPTTAEAGQEGHRFKASVAPEPHPHLRQTPWGQGCSVQSEVEHLPGNPLQSWMHLLLEGQCIVFLLLKILSPTLYSLLTLRSWSKQAETGAMHHRAANLPWATEHIEMLPCDSGWKYVQGRTHSHRHLHTPGPPGPF